MTINVDKKYDFDQIVDRRNSDSLKWRRYGEDVLPMWVADMDFVSPEPVLHALRARVEHGVFGYPDEISGPLKPVSELRQAIVERMQRLYQWSIQPDEIVFIPGVVTAFDLACHATLAPDQAVLIQTPVYHPILNAAQETGVLGQQMPLSRESDGSYSLDLDVFKRCLTPQTKLFLLCNPHNPVGKAFCKEDLLGMAEGCLEHGVVICSDEIHCDLVYSGHRHMPVAALAPEISNNTITLMAPSKTFNLAGLQCSFAIIQNRELRKQYQKSGKGLVPWVNLMGMTAALAAYQEGDPWLQQLLAYLESNRDFLFEALASQLPDVSMARPEATYLAWLDCRNTVFGENPYQFFLEKARLAFNDGETFGPGGKGFVRLNFGCPRSILTEAVGRMCEAMAGFKG